jgi:Family of unknown function (DUF6533)
MGPGNYLASLVTGLYVMRLVTVRFPTSSSVAYCRSDHPTGRILKVNSAIGVGNWGLLTLTTVVASTMSIWDYILTFRTEVDLVWKSKWNFMKGLYLFQRYLPFIDNIWLVFYRQSDISPMFLSSFFLRSNGDKFDGNYVFEAMLRDWRFVKSTHPHIDTVERTHFVSSIYDHWACCIREQVRPYTLRSGVTN